MASLSKDKKSNRTIQFVSADKKRRSIRLGQIPQKAAEAIKAKVEALNAAAISQTSWDSETAAWVGKLDSMLYDKLANAALVPKRSAGRSMTLPEFLTEYISGRTDVKPNTLKHLEQAKKALVDCFGPARRLADISAGDADEFRRQLLRTLGPNTVRRICGRAKQFFRVAVRKRYITESPFADMKGTNVQANRSREFFITRDVAQRVIDACPDAEWRLIFALSRYGGLRCPSEHLALKWSDIDWANGRFTVRSSKLEHHEDKGERVVPIFPELRSYLEEAFDPEAVFVISRYRDANANLRTQLLRIIQKAGVSPWPKLFHNLRASRATELVAVYPNHVAAAWLGHSALIAREFYWQVTEADFERAATAKTCPDESPALHKAVQSEAAEARTELSAEQKSAEIAAENACMQLGAIQSVPRRGVEPLSAP